MRNKSMMKIMTGIAVLAVICICMYLIIDKLDANKAITKSVPTQDTGSEAASVIEPKGSVKLSGQKYVYYENYKTYLLLGTDASGNETATGEDYTGSMADFLLLLVVNKENKSYSTLQLNRDTMTEVGMMQSDGTAYASSTMQLCTAHWYGGDAKQSGENTVNAVSNLLGGVAIDGFYCINMDQIPVLNHAVGGVTLTVQGDFSQDYPSLIEGKEIKLTDEQAYHYIHDRYGVDDGENRSRMERQKQYMAAFTSQIQEKLSQNMNFGLDLYQQLKNVATTDIGAGELTGLLSDMASYDKTGTYQLAGKNRIGQALGDGIDHMEFYPTKKSIKKVMFSAYNLQISPK